MVILGQVMSGPPTGGDDIQRIDMREVIGGYYRWAGTRDIVQTIPLRP